MWLSLQGISKLPDEIISYIMEFVHDSYVPWQVEYHAMPFTIPDSNHVYEMGRAVSDLSCVSRRFRRIALCTTYLWSKILVQRGFPCELFIKRSGDAPLYVTYDFPIDRTQHTIVHEHRKRWKTLDVRHPKLRLWNTFSQDELVFPALESLAVRSYGRFRRLDIPWKTPVLKHLVTDYCLMHISMAANLVSLCIYLEMEDAGTTLGDTKRDLIAFLTECKVLKTLDLTWWREYYCSHQERHDAYQWANDFGRVQQPFVLPSLESLHLNHTRAYNPAFGACLNGIKIPMLSELSITGKFDDSVSDDFSIVDLLGDIRLLDGVRLLRLDVGYADRKNNKHRRKPFEIPFEYIEQHMPRLSELTLGPTEANLRQLQNCQLSSLRSLWLKDSDSIMDDILKFVKNRKIYDGNDGKAVPFTLKAPLREMKENIGRHYDDIVHAIEDNLLICHFYIDERDKRLFRKY